MRTSTVSNKKQQKRQEETEEGYVQALEKRCESLEEKIQKLANEITFLRKFIHIQDNYFCFTGALKNFTRKEVEQKVRELKGKIMNHVSRGTTFLVTNDKTSGSEKNLDAQKYNVPIINEDEFIWLLDINH